MAKKLIDSKSEDFIDNLFLCQQSREVQDQNYFQESRINLGRPIFSQTFGSFNSFNPRQINPRTQHQVRRTDCYGKEKDSFCYVEGQSPMIGLSFQRSLSEMCEGVRLNIKGESQNYEVFDGNGSASEADEQNREYKKWSLSSLFSDLSGQEYKSDSINSHSDIDTKRRETGRGDGLLAKNVTKNIGKLLMKFVWKNRLRLVEELKPDLQVWHSFIQLIKSWRKQNNITRQFLVSRWHKEGAEYGLFRVISMHFFRKHCLVAVFRSNIKLKRVHLERIVRYRQALTDPKALGYLS